MIVGKGVAVGVEVGIDIGRQFHLHIVSILSAFVPEIERIGIEGGCKQAAIGREVAVEVEIQVSDIGSYIAFVVGIPHIGTGNHHLLQLEIELHGSGIGCSR